MGGGGVCYGSRVWMSNDVLVELYDDDDDDGFVAAVRISCYE